VPEPTRSPRAVPPRPSAEATVTRWMNAQIMLERRFMRALGGRLQHELAGLTLLELDAVVQLPPEGSTVAEMAASLGMPEAEARALVTRLVRRRYLHRDRAAGRVVAAARGEQLHAAIRAGQAEVLEYLFINLSGDLRQRMFQLSADLVREAHDLRPGASAADGASSP